MAIWATHSTYATGTGTGNLTAITGLPGTPMALFNLLTRRTTAGQAAHALRGIGAATGTAARWALSQGAEDNVNPNNSYRWAVTDAMGLGLLTAGTTDGKLDLASLDANGYTPTVDTAFTLDTLISTLAIGGLTNAAAGVVTSNATPTQAFTGLGFQPDFLILAADLSSADGSAASSYFSLGFGNGTNNYCIAGLTDDNHTNSGDQRSMISTSLALAHLTANADTVATSWTINSLDADGFTVGRSAGTTARRLYYLALKGGVYSMFTTAASTGTGDITVTTTGNTPVCAFLASRPEITATQATPTGHDELTMGIGTASSQSSLWYGDEDAITASDSNCSLSTTAIWHNFAVADGSTAQGTLAISSFNSGSITLNQSVAASAAILVIGFAIGNASGGYGNKLYGPLGGKLVGKV